MRRFRVTIIKDDFIQKQEKGGMILDQNIKTMSKDELLKLGLQYLSIRNYGRALKYISHAAEQGSSRAANELFKLGKQFYDMKSYTTAEECFDTLSEMGHGESCLYLGEMNEKGLGCPVDIQSAFDYYAAAYQNGLPRGALLAGRLMRDDAMRTQKVRDIAISWFDEAIKGGVYEAYAEIGRLYLENDEFDFMKGPQKDNKTALSWFLRGAIHGDNMSRELAADCFMRGKGTEPNPKRALELCQQAFHDGSVSVCFRLGDWYAEGRGVKKNLPLALAWYLKAYERGDERGKYQAGRISYMLGRLPFGGNQTEEEREKSISYLKQAADYGYTDAYLDLSDLAGDEGDEKARERLLRKGMNAGNDDCRRRLIVYYNRQASDLIHELQRISTPEAMERTHMSEDEFMDYVTKRYIKAAGCLKKAANIGDEEAWAILANMYLYGGGQIGVTDKDFLKAAKNGMRARSLDVRRLLWQYYAGPKPMNGEYFHKENPRKAYLLAKELAHEGDHTFMQILSEYYAEGYGTYLSPRLAAKYAQNPKAGPTKEGGET